MVFEWDPAKAATNQRKHGISFEQAVEIFAGEYIERSEEVRGECRFIALGPTSHGMLSVVYTERSEDKLRLISARRATRREHHLYLEYNYGR